MQDRSSANFWVTVSETNAEEIAASAAPWVQMVGFNSLNNGSGLSTVGDDTGNRRLRRNVPLDRPEQDHRSNSYGCGSVRPAYTR